MDYQDQLRLAELERTVKALQLALIDSRAQNSSYHLDARVLRLETRTKYVKQPRDRGQYRRDRYGFPLYPPRYYL